MDYIFLPEFQEQNLVICDEYKDWINCWLYELNENIEKEIISSSECVQGLICERLTGVESIDWLNVEKSLLRDENGRPLAYSEKYGRQLYKFDSQWKQTPVHAIYNSFWINRFYGKDISEYRGWILSLIQKDGWIYNPEVSNTQIRTRMKSELMMSLAMGTSILVTEDIGEDLKNKFEATLSEVLLTGYVSAEFFRKIALENIQRTYQRPEGIRDMLHKCEVGHAYNDFCMDEKTDDYMGTRKRTQHDTAIHTPLITCMAVELSASYDQESIEMIDHKMKLYADDLKKEPLNIPSFRMRDMESPFGTGITPLEVIAATLIINGYPNRRLL